MFLRCKVRRKDGKQHRYWSVVENTRVAGGRVVQRHVLYLGEINDSSGSAWRKSIDVLEDGAERPRTLSLFSEDRVEGLLVDASIVSFRLSELSLRRPRQWGACWLALMLWRELQLDQFWSKRLGVSRKGTHWDQVLFVLVAYRLLRQAANGACIVSGSSAARWAICWAKMPSSRRSTSSTAATTGCWRTSERVFDHLQERWRDLFNANFDVLLYDLTSTYFEADPPFPEGDKRRFGYSRDHRPDCVQVDHRSRRDARRSAAGLRSAAPATPPTRRPCGVFSADRAAIRQGASHLADGPRHADRRGARRDARDRPASALSGGHAERPFDATCNKHLIAKPWQQARPGVQVKLLAARRRALRFRAKPRSRRQGASMRRRQLKRLWARLKQLSTMQLTREELLMKLGAARDQSRTAWRLVTIEVAAEDAAFSYRLDRNKLRQTRLREGRYMLRTNLVEEDPAKLWSHYLLLVAVEEAFKNLKGDLAIRPVFHQLEARIEAHVFIAFFAYACTSRCAAPARAAPGLTPRSVLEKFAAMQMIDVHLPTTDGRDLVLTRYTEPEAELSLLLQKLKLERPPTTPKSPPHPRRRPRCSADLRGPPSINSDI